AIWHHQHLLADDRQDYAYTLSQAQQFIQTLAQGLGIKPQYVIPAYEDNFYYLWQAGQLPINIDPLTADLSDDSERQRLIRLLNRGLNQPTGYVLPIRCLDSGRWQSSLWPLKRDSLFLIPGDSPMGLRLPLEALPWVVKAQREIHAEHSLFDEHPPLAEIHGEVSKRYSYWQAQPTENTDVHEQPIETVDTEVIHTALCLEVREGCLYVFLPPFTELEHYLELMASIEATAKTLNLAIIIEGYPPPMDPRLLRLSVTPDPGVIEVNIHPAHSWDELVHNTTVLYEQAHQARLGTEKFMLDGRHTGTGGGNHITLGGPTPKDSPFLRRPDVLRSLITYWQHHPSLSYLFSGLFIGPTSQAPRIDEARHESLYELEIAFQRMPEGEVAQPWLVDRLLRHLLVDLTGNTHRAEFCIDKLYSPDTASGRLGLVEMRGFEMPPHARMSLMQMLLLRALVARFWRTPYRHTLVRWGSALHDRFMLPHFIRQDIKAVVEELNEWGYAVQLEWLDPFFEFRFPHYGSVRIDDLHLELRMAIEPWYVLGEEVSGSSTARYVDSSVERLQVRLSGLTDSRYVLTCNQRRVPLHNTGTHGEYVAGIRYRAWQPPSALHPTIPVDAPLIFDLIDTWNARSVGGCTYYVAHPGGRAYDDLPVNAYAAESRRISRFEHFGHTPGHIQSLPEMQKLSQFLPEAQALGPIHPPAEERNREYPYTLDLRRLRYQ
ncbi:MAG: transglutaminase family protein, partial [Pseudomonadota bacterium]|nr:transglutaminase family protein [Pseudomonadota bacterium]